MLMYILFILHYAVDCILAWIKNLLVCEMCIAEYFQTQR